MTKKEIDYSDIVTTRLKKTTYFSYSLNEVSRFKFKANQTVLEEFQAYLLYVLFINFSKNKKSGQTNEES